MTAPADGRRAAHWYVGYLILHCHRPARLSRWAGWWWKVESPGLPTAWFPGRRATDA